MAGGKVEKVGDTGPLKKLCGKKKKKKGKKRETVNLRPIWSSSESPAASASLKVTVYLRPAETSLD